MKSMKVFLGSAHPKLGEEVLKELGMQASKCEVVRFTNSEVKVTIQEKVEGEHCVVIQPTSNPTDTNIMELIFFADALRREGASQVTAIIPYFGYAKQNFQHRRGECVSVEVVIKMLETIGIDKIVTFDIHDEGTKGIFTIPFHHLTAFEVLASEVKKYLPSDLKVNSENIVVVSPDQGGVERAREFSKILLDDDSAQIAVVEKHRDPDQMNKIVPVGFYGEVKGKVAVIVDDMIVSGGTMLPAIDLCWQRGARSVFIAVTHHDFSFDAPQKLSGAKYSKLISSNTIPLSPDLKLPAFVEVSIASLIADEIKNISS